MEEAYRRAARSRARANSCGACACPRLSCCTRHCKACNAQTIAHAHRAGTAQATHVGLNLHPSQSSTAIYSTCIDWHVCTLSRIGMLATAAASDGRRPKFARYSSCPEWQVPATAPCLRPCVLLRGARQGWGASSGTASRASPPRNRSCSPCPAPARTPGREHFHRLSREDKRCRLGSHGHKSSQTPIERSSQRHEPLEGLTRSRCMHVHILSAKKGSTLSASSSGSACRSLTANPSAWYSNLHAREPLSTGPLWRS